jgi:hypothetical protein
MPIEIHEMPIKVTVPEPDSRMEILLHRQIQLAEETNELLRQIMERLPAFKIVPIDAG